MTAQPVRDASEKRERLPRFFEASRTMISARREIAAIGLVLIAQLALAQSPASVPAC